MLVGKRVLPAALLVVLAICGPSDAAEELQQRASWRPPAPEAVRGALEAWLDARDVDAGLRRQIEALWAPERAPESPSQLLQHVVRSIALAEPRARQVVELGASADTWETFVDLGWLEKGDYPAVVRCNLKLHYGTWLALQALYDEAREQLASLKPDQVADPAGLLFYQAVVHHRLLQREPCLEAISRLLENRDSIARRYASVAVLMEADIKPVEKDSLDEVARLMEDIERRLGFGRAGKRVRTTEDEVIAKLDKMIKDLEQQQQQQQMQAGRATRGNIRSNNPAQDSAPLGGSGPGDVDPRDIGNSSGWGNLPPRKRQEALQQISKDLPAHYREVIEEYFRRLARDGGD